MSEMPDPASKFREFREEMRRKTQYLLELRKHTDANGYCSPEGVAKARQACGLDPVPGSSQEVKSEARIKSLEAELAKLKEGK